MADLIEREALVNALRSGYYAQSVSVTHAVGLLDELLRDAPTIDAVQVVRCRDCRFAEPISYRSARYFDSERVRDCINQRGNWKPAHGFSVVDVDGYCDEGERMDADTPERVISPGRESK